MIEYKNALAGSPRTFVDKEILRLKGPEGLVSKSLYSRDQLLGTINTLINLDADQWDSDQYFQLYYVMIRPFEYESISRKHALNLASKFIKSSINIWGPGSTQRHNKHG